MFMFCIVHDVLLFTVVIFSDPNVPLEKAYPWEYMCPRLGTPDLDRVNGSGGHSRNRGYYTTVHPLLTWTEGMYKLSIFRITVKWKAEDSFKGFSLVECPPLM